jgi:hypothetical protein
MRSDLGAAALAVIRLGVFLNECSAIVMECQAQNREPSEAEWAKLKSLDDMQRARVESALAGS